MIKLVHFSLSTFGAFSPSRPSIENFDKMLRCNTFNTQDAHSFAFQKVH